MSIRKLIDQSREIAREPKEALPSMSYVVEAVAYVQRHAQEFDMGIGGGQPVVRLQFKPDLRLTADEPEAHFTGPLLQHCLAQAVLTIANRKFEIDRRNIARQLEEQS